MSKILKNLLLFLLSVSIVVILFTFIYALAVYETLVIITLICVAGAISTLLYSLLRELNWVQKWLGE